MVKPRVFIGSSVEGLNIAYAVQQNLLHEAEVTVWDQGIFELSRTTMESLTSALDRSDFAIFVFSPDDLTRIRNTTMTSVRDNVLFEFGMFIGKLGRDRVFFLLPSAGDLHIPTDLLGVTPGRYESTRTDGSMQAATGAVCHQMRQQMKRIGLMPGRSIVDASTEAGAEARSEKRSWVADFFDKKYTSAKAILENELKSQSDEDALSSRAWILYCDFKERNSIDTAALTNFAAEHFSSSVVQSTVAAILRMEGHVSAAIQLLYAVREKRPKDIKISMALALCHTENVDNANALAELQRAGPDDFPEVAIALANVLEQDEKVPDALRVIQRCHAKHPSHKELRFKYARLAQELDQHNIAIYLLESLASDYPNSIEYFGYLGNSCLQLDMYDAALNFYRNAEKLIKEDQSSQWIVANIGNVFSNKGLPTEACRYLERAVKNESGNEYSHDRLAGALKNKATERKEYGKKCAEGMRQLREASTKALLSVPTEPIAPLAPLLIPVLAKN